MDKLSLISHGVTDAGDQRVKNEDAMLVSHERGLFAVADGLGGLPKGEIASQIAIQALGEWDAEHDIKSTEDLYEAMKAVKKSVNEVGVTINSTMGIATTLTILKFTGDRVLVGHIGDSSAYRLTLDGISKLTTEHTVAEEMRQTMNQAEFTIPEKLNHTLTKCIGMRSEDDFELESVALAAGERFLLCTDGIDKSLDMVTLHQVIYGYDSLEQSAARVLDEVRKVGAMDNMTLIIVACN